MTLPHTIRTTGKPCAEERDVARETCDGLPWIAALLVLGVSVAAWDIASRGPAASVAATENVELSDTIASTASTATALSRVVVPAHRIDIDRADVGELALLPEVGPGLAARIVADRALRGVFGSVEALHRVEGLGPARIEAIRGQAYASGGRPATPRDVEVERRRG